MEALCRGTGAAGGVGGQWMDIILQLRRPSGICLLFAFEVVRIPSERSQVGQMKFGVDGRNPWGWWEVGCSGINLVR